MRPRFFVRPAMIDLKLEEQWEWGTGRGEKTHPHALLSLSSFYRHPPPLVQIFLSPQPSAAVKIKNGGYNFLQEGTEHSLAKTTLAVWATGGRECFDFLDEECRSEAMY